MADSPLVPTNQVQVVQHETGFGHYIQLGEGEVRLAEGLILHEAQVVASVLNRHWDKFVAAFQREKVAAVDTVEAETGNVLVAAGELATSADTLVEEEGVKLQEEASPAPPTDAPLEAAPKTPQHEGTPDAPATPTE